MILKLSGVEKRITLSEEEIKKDVAEIKDLYLPFFFSFSNFIETIMKEVYNYLHLNINLEKIENKEIIRFVYQTIKGFEFQEKILKVEQTGLLNLLNEQIQLPSENQRVGREVKDADQILQFILIAFSRIDKKLNKILPEQEAGLEGDYKDLIHEINDVLNSLLPSNYDRNEIEDITSRIKDLNMKLKYKPASFTLALVSRAFKQSRLSIERFKTLLGSQIRSEIVRATILLTLRNFGAQTLYKIEEKTGICSEELLKNAISLLDRKEITINQVAHENYFDLVRAYPKLYQVIIRQIQLLKTNIDKLSIVSKSIINAILSIADGIFDKIVKIGNKTDTIYDEEAENLRDKFSELIETCSASDLEQISKLEDNRISALIELYNMFRVKMVHEKEPYIIERSANEDREKQLDNFILTAIKIDFERGLLLSILRDKGPLNIQELAARSGLQTKKVVRNVLKLVRDKLIITKGTKNNYFLYDVPRILTSLEEKFQRICLPFIRLIHSFLKLPEGDQLKIDDITLITHELRNISENFSSLLQIEFDSKTNEEIQTQKNQIKLILDRCLRLEEKIPKTRSKFDLTKLAMLSLPRIDEEHSNLVEPEYMVGFGDIEWDINKCLACASCEIICPESAVNLINEWDLPAIFEMSDEQVDDLPENRKKLVYLIKKLAIRKPTKSIHLPKNTLGFGTIKYNPLICIACRKCEDRCPNGALSFRLYWDFPKIIQTLFEERGYG